MVKTTLILLGANGVGKGTQAQQLAQELHIPQISTGDILRAEIKAGSELGRKAKEVMDRGELVADDLIIDMVRKRLLLDDAVRGAIFDGFPRTIPQAEALDKLLDEMDIPLTWVISIDVPKENIIERLSSRRVCVTCGAVFNLKLNPDDIAKHRCPKGEPNIVLRDDDQPDTVRRRLEIYLEKTAPLINYYKNSGKYRSISGEGDTEEVFARVLIAMDPELS
jgi:adenylate kinase